jgi:hypothetical protein
MIRLPQWQFVQDQNGQWHWYRVGPDKVRAMSVTSFPDRMRCVLDAMVSVGAYGKGQQPEASGAELPTSAPLRLRLRDELARARRAH